MLVSQEQTGLHLTSKIRQRRHCGNVLQQRVPGACCCDRSPIMDSHVAGTTHFHRRCRVQSLLWSEIRHTREFVWQT